MEEKNNIIDLCKMFWDIGNKTLASGIVKIKADDQEILEMLPKAFNGSGPLSWVSVERSGLPAATEQMKYKGHT